jgi:Domain of unknown function (DUF4372)
MGLFRHNKNNSSPLLTQILGLIPNWLLRESIQKHKSDKGCHKYRTYDQLVALSFGQLKEVSRYILAGMTL